MGTLLRAGMVIEQLWQKVPGGSGTYIRELTAALAHESGVEVTGIAARHPGGPPAPEGLPMRFSALPRLALYESWNRLGFPRYDGDLDIMHATTWALPATRLPLVVTVHDLAFLRNRGHFTRRGNAFFDLALKRVKKEAAIVITPSQASAEDCYRAGIEPERVRVIYHGMSKTEVSAQQVADFRRRNNLEAPYIMWCGTHEPRKNLAGLIAAFEKLAPEHPDLHLALLGPSGWGNSGIPDSLGPLLERVHILGRVSDLDLACAYAGTEAFVFPSLWEGFGLPVLEAMAQGAPVVTSRDTSMEEVAGDCALLVDPRSPLAIAGAVDEILGGAGEVMGPRGQVRAGEFSWQRSAREHIEAYREARG